jgi:hypothetical protein
LRGSSQFAELSRSFHFGDRGWKVQIGKTMFGRDGLEEIVELFDANGIQHRVPLFGGVGDIGHLPPVFSYQ